MFRKIRWLSKPNTTAAQDSVCYLLFRGKRRKSAGFYAGESAVFLTDFRKYRPDSVKVGNTMVKTYLRPGACRVLLSSFKGDKWSVDFKNTSLFDTFFMMGQRNFNALHQ
jgi:hypothetical protein